MLFVLDESLEEILENEAHELYDQLCVELDRIALARFHQKLLLFVESSRLTGLILSSGRVSSRTKGVFLAVEKARAFKGGLVRRVTIRSRIVAEDNDLNLASAGGVLEIRVPVARVPYGLFDSCILLAENLDDAKAYIILARMRSAASNGALPRVPLKGELRGGGGSTTEREYFQIKSAAERLTLCLLDDDVTYPGGAPSGWRGRIIEGDSVDPSPITAHHCLQAYSIENVLPLDVFRQSAHFSDATRRHAIQADLVHWLPHAEEAHWPYIPLKKSLECSVFRRGAPEGAFWLSAAGHFASYSSKKCLRGIGACSSTCERIPKYSKETLREFSATFESAAESDLVALDKSVPGAMSSHLSALARTVISWCCVGRPLGALPAS